MGPILYTVGAWLLGSAVSRLLVGAGLGIVSFAVLDSIITGFLNQAASSLSGLPQLTLSLLGLAGVSTGISIVGGALLTAAAIKSASIAIGRKK